MMRRTFIHKDCDKLVFGPLLSKFPKHRKVGSGEHSFLTGTLEQLTGADDYERECLWLLELTGQELYELIYFVIGTEGYLGAVEVTEAQANLIKVYERSINPLSETP